MSRTLDRSKPFGTVAGQAEHRYEQDGLRFDTLGACIDDKDYKGSAKPAAREVRTTPDADPAIMTQIAKQSGEGGEGGKGATGGSDEGGETTALETLGLSSKVESALRGAEINTVEALTRCTEAQLIELPNIGAATVKAIKKSLKAAHLELAS